MISTARKWTAAFLTLAAGTTFALADPTLKVGDTAPKLQTGKWVQGEPVKEFQSGKAYIVEFWATWCGPCRVSIPHLNEIHNKYKEKGLIVIGQDCWERDDNLVAPFIKKMGDNMTYRIALDDKKADENGMMAKTWMAAAGRNGIPSAFLVDTKGHIAWIGHPMELKDQIIEDVLNGKFDVKKAAADYEQQKQNEAKLSVVWKELSLAMQQQDWDKASAKLSEAEKLLPEDKRDGLRMVQFDILLGKKEYTAAYKLVGQLADAHKDDVELQNDLAWRIATDESLSQRDLALAETLATRANQAAQGKNPGVLDTLARVLFLRGKQDAAVQSQEKAVALADDEDMKAHLRKDLESYKKGELPKVD
jgi:thiol-disulfide isomerase/thioredoxin